MIPRPSLLRYGEVGEAVEELWVGLTVPCDITIMQPVPESTAEGAGALRLWARTRGRRAVPRAVPGLPGPLSVQFAPGRPLGHATLALALSFVLPQLGG